VSLNSFPLDMNVVAPEGWAFSFNALAVSANAEPIAVSLDVYEWSGLNLHWVRTFTRLSVPDCLCEYNDWIDGLLCTAIAR